MHDKFQISVSAVAFCRCRYLFHGALKRINAVVYILTSVRVYEFRNV